MSNRSRPTFAGEGLDELAARRAASSAQQSSAQQSSAQQSSAQQSSAQQSSAQQSSAQQSSAQQSSAQQSSAQQSSAQQSSAQQSSAQQSSAQQSSVQQSSRWPSMWTRRPFSDFMPMGDVPTVASSVGCPVSVPTSHRWRAVSPGNSAGDECAHQGRSLEVVLIPATRVDGVPTRRRDVKRERGGCNDPDGQKDGGGTFHWTPFDRYGTARRPPVQTTSASIDSSRRHLEPSRRVLSGP